MKKILEVNLYDNFEIRFKTDIDVLKEQELASQIPLAAAFTMLTKLWGGNETSVLEQLFDKLFKRRSRLTYYCFTRLMNSSKL